MHYKIRPDRRLSCHYSSYLRSSSLAVWEQQEEVTAYCNPAAGPGLATVKKWALWRLKPWEYWDQRMTVIRCTGWKWGCLHTLTTSIGPWRTCSNTPSIDMHAHWHKSCIHHGWITSEQHTTKQRDNSLYRWHGSEKPVGKKHSSFEVITLEDLNSYFEIIDVFFCKLWDGFELQHLCMQILCRLDYNLLWEMDDEWGGLFEAKGSLLKRSQTTQSCNCYD